jgi:hypothetical protein
MISFGGAPGVDDFIRGAPGVDDFIRGAPGVDDFIRGRPWRGLDKSAKSLRTRYIQ